MADFKIEYLGNLRTNALHLKSEVKIITDAPVDNNGKGESFSPTDLVASSLASCMMTLMGIKADQENIDLTELEASVTKVMASNPRRISEIHVDMKWERPIGAEKQIKLLKNAALTCPVTKSIHPDIKQVITFNF